VKNFARSTDDDWCKKNMTHLIKNTPISQIFLTFLSGRKKSVIKENINYHTKRIVLEEQKFKEAFDF